MHMIVLYGSILEYSNGIVTYVKSINAFLMVLQCIGRYFNVYYSIKMYFEKINVFSMHFLCIQCICNVFECFPMYLLTLLLAFFHHILIITFLPCAPTYVFAFHCLQWLPRCTTTVFFFSFPLICSICHTIYRGIVYQLLFFLSMHYPTFYVPHCHWLCRP
jgi:hypothetical protein